MMNRTRGISNVAASTGSAVHGALELYIKAVCIDKLEQPSREFLIDLLKLSFSQVFNHFDYQSEEYLDAWDIVNKWYDRTDVTKLNVVSVEQKTFFEVPTSVGPIPFNYIWDRFDQIGERQFKVVDYKTNRWGIQPSDLKKKIQARAYGLACAIQLKKQGIEYDRIWVEFDMLRHSGPVGVSFSHEDNVLTWEYIKATAENIIATPEEEAEERLNPECNFCVRKASCTALQKNIMVGGIAAFPTIEDKIDLRAALDWQVKGLNALIRDLDAAIVPEAKARDLTEYESEENMLKITMSSSRAVDAERVEMVVGPAVMEKYGDKKMTMGNFDKLVKSKDITPEQKVQLVGLIYMKLGDERVKIEPKNPIEND